MSFPQALETGVFDGVVLVGHCLPTALAVLAPLNVVNAFAMDLKYTDTGPFFPAWADLRRCSRVHNVSLKLDFCGGDFHILVEIFKVILCSDFLLSSVIHNFPK
jgi:hypothetical protein